MYNQVMQTCQPKVSVLMPVYNMADTVNEAIESLINQTLKDFEVIAVDDGSSDSSLEVLERWAKKDKRFHIIQSPHSGIVNALNKGAIACNADIIARMDADDRAFPERLEKQVSYLEQHPDIVLVSCQVKAFSKESLREGFQVYLQWQNKLLKNDEIQREIFIESPFAHPSVAFQKKWLERLGGYHDCGWAEDYDLWLRMYLAGARFAKLPEILLEWRDQSLRLTRTDNHYSLENFLRLKAHYLKRGPLCGRESVFLWGAGMMGRRICKYLSNESVPLKAFFDIDPHKIGKLKRGLPVYSSTILPVIWKESSKAVLLVAVGARGARPLIRKQLQEFCLEESVDWWFVA